MEKIFENMSLRFICNAINTGMVEYSNLKELTIVSKTNKSVFIKILDIDITDYVSDLVANTTLKEEIHNVETNFYDYVVFMKTQENDETATTLRLIGLLELITVNDRIISSEKQTKLSEKTEILNWSLDTNDWDLIEEKLVQN